MKTKPLTFLLSLTFLFLFSGSVYGEDEIYYCADTASTGFQYNKNLLKYERATFEKQKFKLKFDRTAKTIEIKGHGLSTVNSATYNCTAPFMASYPEELRCHSKYYSLNFNSDDGRFVFMIGYGYFSSGADSIGIAYGKCDKF